MRRARPAAHATAKDRKSWITQAENAMPWSDRPHNKGQRQKALADLLSNTMHYADHFSRVDFEMALARARSNYRLERADTNLTTKDGS